MRVAAAARHMGVPLAAHHRCRRRGAWRLGHPHDSSPLYIETTTAAPSSADPCTHRPNVTNAVCNTMREPPQTTTHPCKERINGGRPPPKQRQVPKKDTQWGTLPARRSTRCAPRHTNAALSAARAPPPQSHECPPASGTPPARLKQFVELFAERRRLPLVHPSVGEDVVSVVPTLLADLRQRVPAGERQRAGGDKPHAHPARLAQALHIVWLQLLRQATERGVQRKQDAIGDRWEMRKNTKAAPQMRSLSEAVTMAHRQVLAHSTRTPHIHLQATDSLPVRQTPNATRAPTHTRRQRTATRTRRCRASPPLASIIRPYSTASLRVANTSATRSRPTARA